MAPKSKKFVGFEALMIGIMIALVAVQAVLIAFQVAAFIAKHASR